MAEVKELKGRTVDTEVLEDGNLRNPLQGLFSNLTLTSIEKSFDKARERGMAPPNLAQTIKIARRKAKELAEQYSHLSEDQRTSIVIYTMENFPKDESVSEL